MAGTTLNRGYPYPTGTDANDVPFRMQALAEAADSDIQSVVNALTPGPWSTITLNAGISFTAGFPTLAWRLEHNGTMVRIRGARLTYTSAFAAAAGGDYMIASTGNVLPPAARPQSNARYAVGFAYTPAPTNGPQAVRIMIDSTGYIAWRPGTAFTTGLLDIPDMTYQIPVS